MNEYLGSNAEGMSRSHFFRVLALGCFDTVITLPIGIEDLVGNIVVELPFGLELYQGWKTLHSDWAPILVPKSLWSMYTWDVFNLHWDEWINPFYALVFFTLFGLGPEARKGYRRFFRLLGRPFRAPPQSAETEEVLAKAVFRDGRGTIVSTVSETSSGYELYYSTFTVQMAY